MNWPAGFSRAQYQATMPSCIFRIVFDNLAMLYGFANFTRANHALRPVHLPQRVRKKEVFLACRLTNLLV